MTFGFGITNCSKNMKEGHKMKTISIYISLAMLLALMGCGKEVEVQSFETTMQCFRNHTGIQCMGRGIQCHQPYRASQLGCRITIVTKDGVRQDMPMNPLKNERYGQVITWDQ